MPPAGPWDLTAADVRRLCRPAVYARAESLQHAGHVLEAVADGATRVGTVWGTWRRLDQVVVETHAGNAGNFSAHCTCGEAGFCVHAGALLLHWVREPGAFGHAGGDVTGAAARASGGAVARLSREVGWESDSDEMWPLLSGAAAALGATAEVELAHALAQDGIGHLRQIGRRRGLRITGKTKAELVPQLAAALADPAQVDAALAGLSPDARLALEAAALIGAISVLTPPTLQDAYRALGGAGEAQAEELFDLGLFVTCATEVRRYGVGVWLVPRAVVMRLRPRGDLLPPSDAHADGGRADSAPTNAARGTSEKVGGGGLRLGELLLVVAHALRTHNVRLPGPSSRDAQVAPFLPAGWRVSPHGMPAAAQQFDYIALQAKPVQLVPTPRLTPSDLDSIAVMTGASAMQIAFVVHLLIERDIVIDGADGLMVRNASLRAFLMQTPVTRWGLLTEAWLSSSEWLANSVVFGDEGPLQLHYQLRWYGGAVWPGPTVDSFRRLVISVLGLLNPGTWYQVDTLLELLRRLAPNSLGHGWLHQTQTVWRFAPQDKPDTKIELESRDGWRQVAKPLLAALLRGPCTWLGFVEVTPPAAALHQGMVTVRVLPAAGMLSGRDVSPQEVERPASVVLGDDLTVLVPGGQSDLSLHAVLMRAGRLVDGTVRGLRYRLTADGVGMLLEEGWAIGDLASLLEQRAGKTLPKTMAARLGQWEQSYGSVRLYDDIAVVELGDDHVLNELLSTTSLGSHTLQVISPRLVVMDPRGVEDLVAELTRTGRSPRVVEDVPRMKDQSSPKTPVPEGRP